MRHMGGCTECFTVWWGCRCPLRCEECGAGYRDDGNSNCGTPGCRAGDRRRWEMLDRWAVLDEDDAPQTVESVFAVRCDAVDPAGVQNGREKTLPPEEGASRPTLLPKPAHRPVTERRAEVVALLGEGLSNREIARRAKVSPSTVASVRDAQAGDTPG